MWRILPDNLRLRLLLLVLVGYLPVAGLMVLSAANHQQAARERVEQDSLRLAHLAALEQDRLIDGAGQLLITLARLPEMSPGQSEACQTLLLDLSQQYSHYTSILAADAEGNVFCSGLPLAAPVNVSDRAYFARARETRRFVVGEYVVGRLTGKPALILAQPMLDRLGQFRGLVAVGLDLDWISRLASRAELPPGSIVSVVDRDGTILARFPEEGRVGTRDPRQEFMDIIRARGEGVVEIPEMDGSGTRLYAFTPLHRESPEHDLFVRVSIPARTAAIQANRELVLNLGGLAVVTLLALAIAQMYAEKWLMRPLQTLIRATERLGAGDLDARAGLSYQTWELGQLARAFDQTAAKLARQQAEVHAAEGRYRTLVEQIPAVLYSAAPGDETRTLYISPQVEALLGFTAAEWLADSGLWARQMHPEDRERAALEIASARAGGEGVEVEYRMLARDGRAVWVRDEAQVMRDPDGQPQMWQGFLTDVTRRREAEAAERNQRTLAEALRDTAASISSTLQADEVLDRILDSVARVVPYDAAGLLLLEGDHVRMVRCRGFAERGLEHLVLGRRWPVADLPLIREMAETGEPVVVANASGFPDRPEDAAAQWLHAHVGVPVRSHGRVLGFLNLGSVTPGTYTTEHAQRLRILADQAAVAITNARLFAEAQQRLDHLRALRSIDLAITSSMDLRVTLDILLDQVISQLHLDAAAVLLVQPSTAAMFYAATRGSGLSEVSHLQLRVGDGYPGQAAADRKTVLLQDLNAQPSATRHATLCTAAGFVTYAATPLVARGEVQGVLEVFRRTEFAPDREWVDFLEALATQAAIAIDNARMLEGLQQSHQEMAAAYDATLEGWARALELRDIETAGHSARVTHMAMRLARKMGYPERDLVHLRRGAMLHDIGKMGIPDHILMKPGPLTDAEWATMRLHPVYAFELLSAIPFLRPALEIPHFHHERWDGKGYPRQLRREQIPLAARIFAVVDVWDALRSHRPYRPAWPEDQVIDYIRAAAGTQLDPRVVKAFLAMDRSAAEQDAGA